MSITTLTWTFKKSPLSNNSYILMAQGAVTGDGTGGTIAEGKDIIGLLPLNSTVICLDSGWYQNDNAGRLCSTGITQSDFEATFQSTIVGSNSTLGAENNGAYFFSNEFCKVQRFPIYLGHNTSGAFTLSVGCDTNTNGKNYYFWYKFLINLPTQ